MQTTSEPRDIIQDDENEEEEENNQKHELIA